MATPSYDRNVLLIKIKTELKHPNCRPTERAEMAFSPDSVLQQKKPKPRVARSLNPGYTTSQLNVVPL